MKKLVLIFLVLVACSPERRLERLLEHHPELLIPDTVYRHDMVLVSGSNADSLFPRNIFYETIERGDTIVVQRERLVTKIFRVRDTVRVMTTLPGDTIIRKISVPFEKIQVKEVTGVPWWVWLVIGGLVLLLVLALRRKN